MKEKQIISPELNKDSNKALLKEVASKLSNKVLFKEKVERAKAYLKLIKFPSEQKLDA